MLSYLPRIVDNKVFKLFDVLNTVLASHHQADIACGYFNPWGYRLIKDNLNNLEEFRLLLGSTPIINPEIEPSMEMPSIAEALERELEGEALTFETVALIDELLQFLRRDDVQVRRYPHGFLHGKGYIFSDVAVIGSSNFTAAGLSGNTELNAVEQDMQAVSEIQAWFDRFWAESVDFKDELIDILNQSKFGQYEYTPYQIFIKALYEYFQDELLTDTGELYQGSMVELTNFQEEGYKQAHSIIKKYGGVMIADSVGLGKTFIGKKLLEDFAYYQRQKALIICPAQLRDMLWQKEIQASNIPATIQSQEAVSQKDFPLDPFLDFDVVLIDESHNFRNHTTGRYENLMKLLTGGNPKKVILLTATPINNTLFDLYHQLLLLTRNNEYHFRRVGVSHLKTYFKTAVKANTPEALFNLLEAVVIRRPRSYVVENYPDAMINGKPVHFPDRKLHTVRYSLEEMYGTLYANFISKIERLHLVAYNLESYKLDAQAIDKQKRQRSEAIISLMKILYLKRFESSVEAFRISIDNQLRFQRRFLEALQNGRLLSSHDHRKLLQLLPSSDDEESPATVQEFFASLPEVRMEDYDIKHVTSLIESDIQMLQGIVDDLEVIAQEQDTKLQTLKEQLETMQDKKMLLFAYFKDTAKYLYRYLQNRPEFKMRRLRLIDSDVKSKDRETIIKAFAPHAMKAEGIAGTDKEIQWLISTDVLSEGQNLQDCDTVINYDLHWNPTRMIQRAGRIDRMGNPFPLIHIHNFFPEAGLEALLGLVKRLQDKISQINDTIGLDASILGESVDPKTFNTLTRIADEDDSVIGELERFSELASNEMMKQELLNFLNTHGANTIREIPYGVHSGLEKPRWKGAFFYFKARDEHFWRYCDYRTGRIEDNHYRIFQMIHCQPETERVVSEEYDIYDLMQRAARHVVDAHNERIATTAIPTEPDPVQQDISTIFATEMFNHRVDEMQMADLLTVLADPALSARKKELTQFRNAYYQHKDFLRLVKELQEAFDEWQVQQNDTETEGDFEPLTEDELKLVCYDVLS